MSWHEDERVKLGRTLRELRKRAGLTAQQLADRISSNQPKISRIETGHVPPSVDDVRRIASALDASPEQVADLVARADRLQNELQSVRSLLRRGLAPRQSQVGEIETAATSIKNFQNLVIPGLLQTAEYARRIFDMWISTSEKGLTRDPAAAIAARLQRQEILYDQTKSFSFAIGEMALTMPLGPPELLRVQLERVLSLSRLPNLEIMIWHTEQSITILPENGFVIYDDELVTIELLHGGLELRDPRDVAIYIEAFDLLRSQSASGDEARAAITAIISSL